MGDKYIEFIYMSQSGSKEYANGYNACVERANKIIKDMDNQIAQLNKLIVKMRYDHLIERAYLMNKNKESIKVRIKDL